MTPTQADVVEKIARVLRPDWNHTRLRTVLAEPMVAAQDSRQVLVALIVAATNPAATAPGFLLTNTDAWQAARRAIDPTSANRPELPPLDAMCICGRPRHAPNPACDEPTPAGRHRPAPPETAHDHAARIRADLAAKRQTADDD